MAVVVNTRSPSDSRYTLKLNISPRSPDITNNRTTVDWSLVLSFSDSLAYGRYNYDPNPYSVVINGSTVSSGNYTYDFRKSSTKTIASGSTTINHNSDGTKTISASCSAGMLKPDYSYETIRGSGSLTLTTIPRASQPRLSASSVTYGNAITIYTDRKSSAFTHRIRANWNGTTETIANSVGVSYAWTVPMSYLNRIPNAKSTIGTIYLDTYSGGTLIGTKTVRLTTNAPSNIGPNIGSVNLTEAVSGIASQFGAFVQSKSRIKVTGSATGQYGASIKSYQIQINRETENSSTYTSGYLVSSGQEKVVFRATDSRGYTSTKTVVFNVLPYTPPRIDSFNAYRSDASGTVDQQGEYALARYKASITPLGDKNTKAYKIRYRPVGATSWTEIALSSDSYGPSSQRVLPNVSTESSYEIEFIVSDYFSTASTMVKISTAFVKVRFGPGNQIGIGKVPEKNGLEVALPTYFYDPVEVLDPMGARNPVPRAYVDGSINHPIWIPAGADLNDYKEPGFFYQSQTANTSGMLNIPHKVAFSLEVIRTNEVTQIFRTFHADFRVYVRAIYTYQGEGGWSNWRCVYDHTYYNALLQKGSNSNGSWEQYYDGRLIQYGVKTLSYDNISSDWGGIYFNSSGSIQFPRSFVDDPVVTLSLAKGSSGHAFWLGSFISGKSGVSEIHVYRPANAGTCNVDIHWYAIGKY